MKHTLHVFLTTIFLLTGINSFAEKKSNDTYACPTANISYVGTPFCSSDTSVKAVTLTGTDAYLGGVFSSTVGLNLNPTTGAITPNTSIPGAYTVVYAIPSGPGCPGTFVTTIVSIYQQANAGTDGSTTICESSLSIINLYSIITGEETGGTWVQTSGTGGTFNFLAGTFTPTMGVTTSTFTYTVSGTSPCSNDSSVVTINISPQPVAGNDGMTSVSETSTSPIDLFSLIIGEQLGGIWTRTSGTGGTFNAGLGTFTPAIGATTSTFTYNLFGIMPCVNDISIATINIQPLSSETFIANNIKLSPNPVTDILNIENEFQINSIKVYNQLGQMVFGKQINNNNIQLDLSNINSGIYNVMIETEKGTFNHKIVKK
jgi:hypothetical protein